MDGLNRRQNVYVGHLRAPLFCSIWDVVREDCMHSFVDKVMRYLSQTCQAVTISTMLRR